MDKIINAIEKTRTQRRVSEKFHSVVADEHQAFYADTIVLDPEHLSKNRIIAHDKRNPINGPFDLLRTQTLRLMNENSWQTLAISSPTAECGKTVSAINLAMSMARQQSREIILLDFDFIKPQMFAYLGLQPHKTIFDYLTNSASVDEILIKTDISNLTFFLNDQTVHNTSEVMSSASLEGFILEVKNRFPSGIFIFDLPPMLVSDDVIAFLPQVDCTLMIVASWQTTVSDIEKCAEHLESTNFLGFVLNKFEGQTEHYYY